MLVSVAWQRKCQSNQLWHVRGLCDIKDTCFLTSILGASLYFSREKAASLGGMIDEATQETDVVCCGITAHGTWCERL